MLKQQKNLILNVLISFLALISIGGCSFTNPNSIPTYSLIEEPKPIVPKTEILNLRDVNWIIITESNIDTIFQENQNPRAFFALTPDGFQELMLNMNDILSLLRQQKVIIQITEK